MQASLCSSNGPFAFARLLTLLLLSLLLCGCAVTRYGSQADGLIDLPAAYALEPPGVFEVWNIREAFDSPELAELLERAFGNNMNLQAAWARISQSEAAEREARAALFPGLRGSFDAERTNAPAMPGLTGGANGLGPSSAGGRQNQFDSGPRTTNRFRGSIGASYEIDVWGRLRSNQIALLRDAEAARWDAEVLAVWLVAEVIEAWAAIGAQRERQTILGQQLETSENILELTRIRFERGGIGAQEVAEQAQQTETIRGQLILLEMELWASRHRMAVLIGEAPGRSLSVRQEVLPRPLPVQAPGVPGELLERRPDVRAARLRLEGADERTAAAVADRLPRLQLTASLFDEAQRIGELFSDLLWSLGGSLEQEFFTGGRRRAAVAGAEAGAQAELFEYGQTLLEALQEVQDAIVIAQRQQEYVVSLERQLEFSEIAFEAALGRYRQGDVDFMGVLINLQTANEVELSLLDAREDLFSSRVQLWRVLGGGGRLEADRNDDPS